MRFDDLLDGAAGVEGLWHLGGSREMWCRVRVFESERRGFDVAECFVLMLGLTVDVHVHEVCACSASTRENRRSFVGPLMHLTSCMAYRPQNGF
jgi:hypothetical protein